jgi:tight adherence protein C
MVELIALLVFASLTLLTWGVSGLATQSRSVAAKRLIEVTSGKPAELVAPDFEPRTARFRLASQLVESIGFWTESKFEQDKAEKKTEIEQLLSHAGIRGQRVGAFFKGARVLSALIGAGIGVGVAFSRPDQLNPMLLAVVGLLGGFFLPKWYLNLRIGRRHVTITKSLPDVLDMLIICVEAGMGLNAALDRVANERNRINPLDVMGFEIKYMTYELQAGVPREQAFQNIGVRNGVEDLRALSAFMIQSEKLGGSLVEALKIYASELRTKRRQRAQEQANKAAVKLLFPLMLFIFPTMFIVILAPAVMQLTSAMKGLH